MSRTNRNDRPRDRYSLVAPSPETLQAVWHERPDDLEPQIARAALDPLEIVALEQRCAPVPGSMFIDPLTRRRYAYHVDECDRRGRSFLSIE